MPIEDSAQWYQPGDIVRSIRTATLDTGVSLEEIVDVLEQNEFDVPRKRLRLMVEEARENLQDYTPPEERKDLSVRASEPRFIDVEDVAYLRSRDFAVVVGAALSRFNGSFYQREENEELALDLFWDRQHLTTGFRTIARPTGEQVGESYVRELAEGKTNPTGKRQPSTIAIVSTSPFTEAAVSTAEVNNIELFGRRHLRFWLQGAQLSHTVLGELLENSELTTKEIEQHLAQLPDIPDSVRERDPLEEIPEKSRSQFDGDLTRSQVKRKEMISELQRLAQDWKTVDRVLVYSVGDTHPTEFAEVFGSFEAALTSAGVTDSTETEPGAGSSGNSTSETKLDRAIREAGLETETSNTSKE